MRMRNFLGLVALGLSLSGQSQAIHGGQYLYNLLNSAAKQRDPNAALYQRLYEATGHIVTIDSDPLEERTDAKSGRQGIVFSSFAQSNCSAIHFRAPAYFISSAVCFAGADGKIDPNRRYGKVFVKTKGWTIDPLSIVIHSRFRKGPSDNDLVIFSLEPSEVAAFDAAHSPILPVSPTSWVTEGQHALLLGYGVTKEDKGDFGYPVLKDFIQTYPDGADLQDSNGKLLLSPEENLLTYIAKDGVVGVNCLGDSGGGGFVRLNDRSGNANLYLQSIIVGKVGPDGNPSAGCDQISKYSVGVDLRYYSEWFDEAIAQITKNREAASAVRQEFAAVRKTYYGGKHYELWIDTPAEQIEAVKQMYIGVGAHELNKQLYAFMVREQKRMQARQYLTDFYNKPVQIPWAWTEAGLPSDPWAPSDQLWVEFSRGTSEKGLPVKFYNPATGASGLFARVQVRNVGDKAVKISGFVAGRGSNEVSSGGATLLPGDVRVIDFKDLAQVSSATISGLDAKDKVSVHGILGNQQQLAARDYKLRQEAWAAEQKRRKDEQERLAAERQREWDRQQREKRLAWERENREIEEHNRKVREWNKYVDEYNSGLRSTRTRYYSTGDTILLTPSYSSRTVRTYSSGSSIRFYSSGGYSSSTIIIRSR